MDTSLTEYLNGAIETVVNEAMRSSLKNPRESAFILRYSLAQKKAAKKRCAMEKAGKHIPPFLIASISTLCNLHCKGCYARANHSCGDEAGKMELPAFTWKRIFGEAEKLGISFILLAGGEPLLRMDIIKTAAEFPGIVFPVFTNGTVAGEPCMDLFDKKRNLVPVLSIEGDRVQTDERRGEGTYEALVKTMDGLKRRGIFYGASITVTTRNLDTVTSDEFAGMLHRGGCKLVFYVEYVPVADSTEELALKNRERRLLTQRQQMLKDRYENMIFISFPGDEEHTGGCLAAGRGFFHINPNGGAEPCPFSPYSDFNLKDCSLQQALESPLFHKLDAGGLLNAEHIGGCVLFGRRDEVEKMANKT